MNNNLSSIQAALFQFDFTTLTGADEQIEALSLMKELISLYVSSQIANATTDQLTSLTTALSSIKAQASEAQVTP